MRKLIAMIAIGVIIVAGCGTLNVNANSITLDSGSYQGTGSCSISSSSASAYTRVSALEPAYVSAEYRYLENYHTSRERSICI